MARNKVVPTQLLVNSILDIHTRFCNECIYHDISDLETLYSTCTACSLNKEIVSILKILYDISFEVEVPNEFSSK